MMRKLLIIDDNPTDIDITRMVLEERGWDLTMEAFESAEKALGSLRAGTEIPSLILLDLNIPGMGGMAFLRQIHADERLHAIPLIMATASSFERDEKEAYEAGADLFLYKELDIDRYSENLDAALKRLIR